MRYSIRFDKREHVSWHVRVLDPILCVALALLFCSIIISLEGHDPLVVYRRMFKNAFGSPFNLWESMLQAIPLMFCSLGVSVAFKISISNIGAEGQASMGAFAATAIALYCKSIPAHLVLPAMVACGFLAGALWAVLTVIPKITLDVNETIVTLMSNYIALLFIDYWCYGPWRDRAGNNYPYSAVFPEYAQFPRFGSSRLNTSLLVALAIVLFLFFFYRYTTEGYKMKVIGDNQKAARYAGIDVKRSIITAMVISGGIAGLAGVAQTGGVSLRLEPNIANGAGYTAIVIAYMSHLNPFAIVIVSILFGGLVQGGLSLQIIGISSKIVTMFQGVILLFVLSGEIFVNHTLVVMKKGGR